MMSGRQRLISGILLSSMTAAMAVTAFAGGRLTERWSYRPVTALGLSSLHRRIRLDEFDLDGRVSL